MHAHAVTGKYVITSCIELSTMAMIIGYKLYMVQPTFTPHGGRQHCAWANLKKKWSGNTETPPWFRLLADYNATIGSGRNLYVWPTGASIYRLGNRLFNYAATFGIAWRNRRIPIWPTNRVSEQFDITKFFNLRILFDRNNSITNVREIDLLLLTVLTITLSKSVHWLHTAYLLKDMPCIFYFSTSVLHECTDIYRERAFDWGQVTDGAHLTGVNDLPSVWRDGRASDYSDRAALLLMPF